MSLNDYRKKYTQDGTGEDVPVGWTLRHVVGQGSPSGLPTSTQTNGGATQDDPFSLVQRHLSIDEQKYFTSRFAILNNQTDNDPALESTIRDIVANEINMSRYQEQITKITRGFSSGKMSATDSQRLSALSKILESAQKTTMSLMSALAVTRADKQRAKKVIESTPSRYVAAYERIQRNFNEDQLKKARAEEQEAMMRLKRKAPNFQAIAKEPEVGV